MATADRILALKLIANTDPAAKSVKGLGAQLKKSGAAAKSWGKAFLGGALITGVEALKTSMDDAATGFKEGEQAASRLGSTWKNLDLPARRLASVIDEIGARTLELGTDDTEALDAFNRSLAQTGNVGASMRRLNIAQNLVGAGLAPNLKAAFKIIDGTLKGSAGIMQRFGLKAKTAKGRLRELADMVKGAADRAAEADPLKVSLNGIAEAMESISGAISTGDLEGLAGGLRELGSAAGSAAGQTGVLSSIVGQFSGTILATLTVGLLTLAGTITLALLPAIAALVVALTPVWLTIGLAVAATAAAVAGLLILQGIMQNIQASAQSFGNAISNAFDDAFGDIGEHVHNLSEHVRNLLELLGLVHDEVASLNVARADYARRYGSLSTRRGMGEGPWWPELPTRFGDGGIVDRPTLALIGEKGPEAVVPLGTGGGMGWGGITINVTTGVGDPVEIGRQVDRVLRAYRGRAGLAA